MVSHSETVVERRITKKFSIIFFNSEHTYSDTLADHRSVLVPHSTGAAVSGRPQQHHQHHTSTSSSANVSFMSTDPTLTDTDSSLETASAAAAAAAAAAPAPLGCCR